MIKKAKQKELFLIRLTLINVHLARCPRLHRQTNTNYSTNHLTVVCSDSTPFHQVAVIGNVSVPRLESSWNHRGILRTGYRTGNMAVCHMWQLKNSLVRRCIFSIDRNIKIDVWKTAARTALVIVKASCNIFIEYFYSLFISLNSF